MRHIYWLVGLALLVTAPPVEAQTTTWRPFRPGIVYSFLQARGTATPTHVHTLRVDSAYVTATGDSVYTFNRLLRQVQSGTTYSFFRSRNNLLGARLRWQPDTRDYYLEANAEPALGAPLAPVALLLRPRAVVGSTWNASPAPALTATLTSRTLGMVGNVPDSLATITLSNGQFVVLSRRFGLVEGPQWLSLSATNTALPANWQQFGPSPAGLGPYDPRTLFALDVGDEVGYTLSTPWFAPVHCQSGYRLRRIVARQQTADSLLLTYKEQDVVTTTTAPGCSGTPGTAYSPIRTGRWAFSLRTGASPQWPFLGLLAGEYRQAPSGTAWLMGQGYDLYFATGDCLLDNELMDFMGVYGTSTTGPYLPGIDYLALNQYYGLSLKVGPNYFTDYYTNVLAYYRRGSVSCGQPLVFAGLLPSRAAQAMATATLSPNPTPGSATLALATPCLPGTVLALRDALGRHVWQLPVAAGEHSLTISLASQPAGLYLVQLLAPTSPPLTWKLVKQ